MEAPQFISDSQVKTVISWALVNDAVEEALKSVTRDRSDDSNLPFSNQPARSSITTDKPAHGMLKTMPGLVGNYQLSGNRKQSNTLACKVVSVFPENEKRSPPVPTVLASILLFDNETGQLKCVMDGTEITTWRTASASLVATKYLYFRRPSRIEEQISLSIVGCGVQGRIHAFGFCSSFDVAEVLLWNRNESKAASLRTELDLHRDSFKNKNLKISVTSTPKECVSKADVIVVATNSPEPLIHFEWLKGHVHINAVGAGLIKHSELAQSVYNNADVYIDNWAGAKDELKDLEANIVSEVGDVINEGKYPKAELTVFQSLGMAAEDACVAQAIYDSIQP